MYHWIAAISPERSRGFLSFLTGGLTVMGWIFTTASTNLIYAQSFMALVALYHVDMTIKAWQTFLVYQVLNLITAAIVIWGNRIIPALNKFSLFYLQIGWYVCDVIDQGAFRPLGSSLTFPVALQSDVTSNESPKRFGA
jgi:choline transport protein